MHAFWITWAHYVANLFSTYFPKAKNSLTKVVVKFMLNWRITKQMARNSFLSSTQLQCSHPPNLSLTGSTSSSKAPKEPTSCVLWRVHSSLTQSSLFMSVWSVSQNRNITFKRGFQEATHVHFTPQRPVTDTLSILGGIPLIHINDMPVTLRSFIIQVVIVYIHPSNLLGKQTHESIIPWIPEFTLGHNCQVHRCSEVLGRKIPSALINYNSKRKNLLYRGNNLPCLS